MATPIQILILLCFVSATSGWLRFRYPLSRRNYLQQTAMEMLQNCARNPEEMCGVCGEGPNELPTELISINDYQLVNVSDGPMDIGLGFRMNMHGFFEVRLCNIGPNSVANAEYCRKVVPLKIENNYQYIPAPEETSARLRITLPPEAACEKCVLQVKYIPGIDSRLAGQIFFDCALLRIPPNPNNLRMAGRILMSTDSPIMTTASSYVSSNSLKASQSGSARSSVVLTETAADSALKTSQSGSARSSVVLTETAADSALKTSQSGSARSSVVLTETAADSAIVPGSPTDPSQDVSRFTDVPFTSPESSKVSSKTVTVTETSRFNGFPTKISPESAIVPNVEVSTVLPSNVFTDRNPRPRFEAGTRIPIATVRTISDTRSQFSNSIAEPKRQSTVFENVFNSNSRFTNRQTNRNTLTRFSDMQISRDSAIVQLPFDTTQNVSDFQRPDQSSTPLYGWTETMPVTDPNPINVNNTFGVVADTSTYIATEGDGFRQNLTSNEFLETKTIQTSTDQNIANSITVDNSTYGNSIDNLVNQTTMLPMSIQMLETTTTYNPLNDTLLTDSKTSQGSYYNDTSNNSSGVIDTTVNETIINTFDTYDTGNVNSNVGTMDYYYDYYTYSEIPVDETISSKKETVSKVNETNSTMNKTISVANETLPLQTNLSESFSTVILTSDSSVWNDSNTMVNDTVIANSNTVNSTMSNIAYPVVEPTTKTYNSTLDNITYLDTKPTTSVYNWTMQNDTYFDIETTTSSATFPTLPYVDVEVTTGSQIVDKSTTLITDLRVPFTTTDVPVLVNYTTTQALPSYIEASTVQQNITDGFIDPPFDSATSGTLSYNSTQRPPTFPTYTDIPINADYNDTFSDISYNATAEQNYTRNGTIDNVSGGQLSQQIVVVPDTLFDRVLFPFPRPDQDIVRVPDTITVFPTRPPVQRFNDPATSRIGTTSLPIDNVVNINQQAQQTTQTFMNEVPVTSTIKTPIDTRPSEINNNVYETPSITTTTSGQLVVDTTNFDITTNPYNTYPTVQAQTTNFANQYPTTNIPSESIQERSGTFTTERSYIASKPPLLDPRPSVIIPLLTDGATVLTLKPFATATDITFISNIETGGSSQKKVSSGQETGYITKDIKNTSIIQKDTIPGRKQQKAIESQTLTDAEQLTLLKHTEDVIKAFVGRSTVKKGEDSTMRSVFPKTEIQTTPIITVNHANDAVSYLPDFGGHVDGIGGVPIQQDMFIDLYIPKFTSGQKTNNIKLEKVDSTNVLTNVDSSVERNAQMDLLTKGLKNRDILSNAIKSANTVVRNSNSGRIKYVPEPAVSFGKLTKLSVIPTTDSWILGSRRASNEVKRKTIKESSSGQFSNFVPINNDRGSLRLSVGNQPEVVINSFKAPDIMPPIFVPKSKWKKTNKQEKNQFVSFDIDNNLAPPPIFSSTSDKRVSTNTVWKGPGINNFGLISEPTNERNVKTISENLKGNNDFFGVTGPVYVPINEISIPLNERRRSSNNLPRPTPSSKEMPNYKVINTTYSTLWDLNRQNRNVSKQSRSPSVSGINSINPAMPPYIGIPLVWSTGVSSNGKTVDKVRINEQKWKDLPVPDIMPPIKVKLLNITSKGTFVDNKSKLNQTNDVNQRILKKLEVIVGELQRNSALLTQTLDVNPETDQGVQLAFEQFPSSELSGLNSKPRNSNSMSWFDKQRTNLLSEVVQHPVSKTAVANDNSLTDSIPLFSIPPYVNSDQFAGGDIKPTMATNNFRLMNMLGISDLRPLEPMNGNLDIAFNVSDYNLGNVDFNNHTNANQTNVNQTIIDTDMLGNDTFTLLTNTLKALMTNESTTTPFAQIGTDLTSLLGKLPESTTSMLMTTLLNKENIVNITEGLSNMSDYNENTTSDTWWGTTPTKQAIINVTHLSYLHTDTTPNNDTIITTSNQLVVAPTGSEFLDPFAGTNISLTNGSFADSGNITRPEPTMPSTFNNYTMSYMVDPSSMSNNTTNTGQVVVSASETVNAVNNLKRAKVIQRNMTSREKKEDTIVRSNFNSRVKGIAVQHKPTIAMDNNYYVDAMNTNAYNQIESTSRRTNANLNKLKLETKSVLNTIPDTLRTTTSGIRFPVRVTSTNDFTNAPLNANVLNRVSGHARTNFLLNSIPVETNILNQVPVRSRTETPVKKITVQTDGRGRMPFRATSNRISRTFPLEINAVNTVSDRNMATRNKFQVLPINNVAVNSIQKPSRADPVPSRQPVLVRNEPIAKQLNLRSMQLSEFSESPLVNGNIVTITEQPMEALPRGNQFFDQRTILNSLINDGQSPNTQSRQSMGISGRNSESMMTTTRTLERSFAGTNILPQRVEANIYPDVKPVIRDPTAYTDNFNANTNGRVANSYSSTPAISLDICLEGQVFVCKSVGDYSSVPGMHWWCFKHCKKGEEFCPKKKCKCACELEQNETAANTAPAPLLTDNRMQDRKYIKLTLNGSEEGKIPLSATSTTAGTRDRSTERRTNSVAVTQYDGSETRGQRKGELTTAGTRDRSTERRRTNSVAVTQYDGSETRGQRKGELIVNRNAERVQQQSVNTKRANRQGLNSKTVQKHNLTCKGINAFAGKPEIDRWCTRSCNRNVCPADLCLCL